MSQVEEEKYLTNRCKVERIKAKVKIRFKAMTPRRGRQQYQHQARNIGRVPIGQSEEGNSNLPRVLVTHVMNSKCSTVIAKHWSQLLWGLVLLAAAAPTVSDAKSLPRYSSSLDDRPSRAASVAIAGRLTSVGNSELSFEYLNLKTIPSDQLCQLVGPESVAATTSNQINLVSFANNQVSQINSSAFICIGTRLKILNLRNNKIELISAEAFTGLIQLQVLLLDGNLLRQLAASQLNYLSATLRHLNLANNLIESVDSSATPALNLPNLISLNLKSNPISRMDRDAFKHLHRLKTLTLSQISLNRTGAGGHLNQLDGLPELRYLHLDQLANLTTLNENYCETSRKLASLSLKSNQLMRVPQFTNCQALLSIDLSYNKISGTLSGNFSMLTNLIDLYLGHNQLETLAEGAFRGLQRLQVLELNSNKLKMISVGAFLPIRASLYELNLAHNVQLAHMTHLQGLDRLVSFKSYGNNQLRKLPSLPRAKLLALTYAYHCCDYTQPSGRPQTGSGQRSAPSGVGVVALIKKKSVTNNSQDLGNIGGVDNIRTVDSLQDGFSENVGDDNDDDDDDDSNGSLMRQLSELILTKLASYLWHGQQQHIEEGSSGNGEGTETDSGGEVESRGSEVDPKQGSPAIAPTVRQLVTASSDDAIARNISEFVLWPSGESGILSLAASVAESDDLPLGSSLLQLAPKLDANDQIRASNRGLPSTQKRGKTEAVTQLQQHQQGHRARRWGFKESGQDEYVQRGIGRSQEASGAGDRRQDARALPKAQGTMLGLIDELIWQVKKIRFQHSVGSNGVELDGGGGGGKSLFRQGALRQSFLQDNSNTDSYMNYDQQNSDGPTSPAKPIRADNDGRPYDPDGTHLHRLYDDDDEDEDDWRLLFLFREHSSSSPAPPWPNYSSPTDHSRHATDQEDQAYSDDDYSSDLLADLVAKKLATEFDAATPATPPTPSFGPLARLVSRQHSEHEGKESGPERGKRFATTNRAEQQQHHPKFRRVQCLPQPNPFQPCRDLFDSFWLRASIWLVFLLAFIGNILVIIVLGSVRPSSSTSALTSIMWFNAAQSKRHIDVPRFLVINLAVADLLMALYLGILAFVDLSTLGEFKVYAIKWQYSNGCKLAGFLAVLSSELSVFILAIITLERNYAITNAVHLNRRLSLHKAVLIMLLGYIYAFAMAILPLNGINDYCKTSICLPLEFHPDVALLGSWANVYLLTLISINALSFILLVSCYLRMYCAIRGSQAWNTNDLKIAKRMSILVITDFMCWIPIIFVAIFSLLGHYLVGLNGLKILIVFVLPLNSVANPFLYAITTKKFKRDLNILKKRLKVAQIIEHCCLIFKLLTTCKRQKAEQQRQRVEIRRNRHKCLGATCNKNKSSPQPGHAKVLVVGQREQQKQKQLQQQHHHHQKRGLHAVCQLPITRSVPNWAIHNQAEEERADSKQVETATAVRVQQIVLASSGDKQVIGKHKVNSQLLAKTMRLIGGGRTSGSLAQEQAFDESQFHQARGGQPTNITNNQVTMNKTTCPSCHQKLALATANAASSNGSIDLVIQKNSQAHSIVQTKRSGPLNDGQHHQHVHKPTVAPRIVLDSMQLHPNNELVGSARTPLDFIEQQKRNCYQLVTGPEPSCQSVDSSKKRESSVEDGDDENDTFNETYRPQQVSSKKLARSTNTITTTANCRHSIRPSSADNPASSAATIVPYKKLTLSLGASGQTRCRCLNEIIGAHAKEGASHLSCQTVLIDERDSATRLDTATNEELIDLDPTNRSVSACAFNWPSSKNSPVPCLGPKGGSPKHDHNQQEHRLNLNTSPTQTRVCSCSCDGIRTKRHTRDHNRKSKQSTTGTGRQSRSINRLVFGPIAKAWSSLQLSLQAQLASASTTTIQQHQSNCAVNTGNNVNNNDNNNHLGSRQQDLNGEDSSESARSSQGDVNSGSDQQTDDDMIEQYTIIDDILQMSSPTKRRLLNERRMSRSCDMIPSQSSKNETTSSSGAMNEPSSSFYDQNDDQRILLATINQLTTRRKKNNNKFKQVTGASGGSSLFGRAPIVMDFRQPSYGTAFVNKRASCTRCRSWSPALLDKLEDCMYQIKSRIPKLGSKDKRSNDGGGHEARNKIMPPAASGCMPHSNTAANGSRGAIDQANNECNCENHPGHDELMMLTKPELTGSKSSSSSSSHNELNGSRDSDESREIDDFNEIGLIEWAQNMQMKGPISCLSNKSSRRRLHQQLSGNSDTLSGRTVGTTVTSLSFDSSSNIPAIISGHDQQLSSSRVDSIHETRPDNAANSSVQTKPDDSTD